MTVDDDPGGRRGDHLSLGPSVSAFRILHRPIAIPTGAAYRRRASSTPVHVSPAVWMSSISIGNVLPTMPDQERMLTQGLVLLVGAGRHGNLTDRFSSFGFSKATVPRSEKLTKEVL